MNLLKFMIVGAIVGYGVNFFTKKGIDGRSILDDITDQAPDWFDKAKAFATETVEQVKYYAHPKDY